jgi:hypothetical protein
LAQIPATYLISYPFVVTKNLPEKMNSLFVANIIYLVFKPVFDTQCGFLGTGEFTYEDEFRINSSS